ncbi:MAG: LytR C-terminal domain-containing protein [Candidatus Bipolaricaulaceae bacterium]
MRRLLVLLGLVLLGLGAALFFAFTRTEVRRALAQGEPFSLLLLFRTGIPSDAPGPDLALLVSLLPQGQGAWVVVPGSLHLPGEGGWRPLAEGGEKAVSALAALLELPLAGVAEIPPATWDALVRELGGVLARPEERLLFQDPLRQVFIDLPAGEQLLDGPRSRQFLAYLLRYRGEPDLAGVRAFVEDFVARAQHAPALLRRFLTPPQFSAWTARDFWEGLARAPARVEGVPVAREDGRLMPDVVRIRKLRAALVSGRAPLTREEVRVFLLNGTRERFLATRAAAWLAARGFTVVGVGPADRPDYTRSLLLVRRGAEERAELVRAVLPKDVAVLAAEAFGLERLGGWPEGADVVLLLGVGFDVGS